MFLRTFLVIGFIVSITKCQEDPPESTRGVPHKAISRSANNRWYRNGNYEQASSGSNTGMYEVHNQNNFITDHIPCKDMQMIYLNALQDLNAKLDEYKRCMMNPARTIYKTFDFSKPSNYSHKFAKHIYNHHKRPIFGYEKENHRHRYGKKHLSNHKPRQNWHICDVVPACFNGKSSSHYNAQKTNIPFINAKPLSHSKKNVDRYYQRPTPDNSHFPKTNNEFKNNINSPWVYRGYLGNNQPVNAVDSRFQAKIQSSQDNREFPYASVQMLKNPNRNNLQQVFNTEIRNYDKTLTNSLAPSVMSRNRFNSSNEPEHNDNSNAIDNLIYYDVPGSTRESLKMKQTNNGSYADSTNAAEIVNILSKYPQSMATNIDLINKMMDSKDMIDIGGLVELIYLFKTTKPVFNDAVCVYYIKCGVPVAHLNYLLQNKPWLRSQVNQFIKELLLTCTVIDVSTDLKKYSKKDIISVASQNAQLVSAKIVPSHNLDDQIAIVHGLNSELTPEDIWKIASHSAIYQDDPYNQRYKNNKYVSSTPNSLRSRGPVHGVWWYSGS